MNKEESYKLFIKTYSEEIQEYLSKNFGDFILPKGMILYHMSKNQVDISSDIMDMYFHPSEACIFRNGYNYETQYKLLSDIKVTILLSDFENMKMKPSRYHIHFIKRFKLYPKHGYISSTGTGEGLIIKVFNAPSYLEKITTPKCIRNSWLILNKNDRQVKDDNPDVFIYPSHYMDYPIIIHINDRLKNKINHHLDYMKDHELESTFENILRKNEIVFFHDEAPSFPIALSV